MDMDRQGKSLRRTPPHIRHQQKPVSGDTDVVSLLEKVIKGLERLTLAERFGTPGITQKITLGSTPTKIKEHKGDDDRLIVILNNDISGGKSAFISNSPSVSNGVPIFAGNEKKFLLVRNSALYAKAESGSPEIRIQEFTKMKL